MSHLIYAWELGGGSGHIGGFAAIANLLQSRHHKISFIVKDLVKAESLVGDRGFRYFQAPSRHVMTSQQGSAASYSGLLLISGFDREQALLARVKAWVNLLQILAPDLLIIDHSPTALLAAKILNIPFALFGSGFFAPPLMSPLPSFRTWLHIPPNHLEQADKQALAVINNVLSRFEVNPLPTLCDLFEGKENFLCTFKELDHYPMRDNATYWGPRFDSDSGDEIAWPKKGRKKIFVYVHPYYPNLASLLETLQASDYSIVIYCPGIAAEYIRKYEGKQMVFTDHALRVAHIAKQCDLVICNAGHGLVSAMLLTGTPLLLLPIHVEQLIIARLVAGFGAGLFALPENKQPPFKKMMDSLLGEKSFKQAAVAFADKHTDFDIHERDKTIVDRIEEILKSL